MKRAKIATNIEWDTDVEFIPSLPSEVEVPADIDDDDIADFLSDEYEFCVKSFSIAII